MLAEPEDASPAPVITAEAAGSPFGGSAQFPAPVSLAVQPLTEGALARAPESAAPPSGAPSMEAVRHAIGCALVDAGHSSAAQLLGTGAWTLDGASLRIEVPGVGKKMLALTVNAAAEKIDSPGAATAGRAGSLSGGSRGRRGAGCGTGRRLRWQAAFRRRRSPIRLCSGRRRSSRPKFAACSICAQK